MDVPVSAQSSALKRPASDSDDSTSCEGEEDLSDESLSFVPFEKFFFQIYDQAFGGQCGPANTVISPLSALYALGMLLAGAGTSTQTDIAEAIGVAPDEASSKFKIITDILQWMDKMKSMDVVVANKAFIDKSVEILPTYLSELKSSYSASAENMDFEDNEAKQKINDWVKESTRGLIQEIAEAVGADDVFVLLNTIYFKGQWEKQFPASLTQPAQFRAVSSFGMKPVQVELMHQKSVFKHANLASLEAQAVELPFTGDASMVIILPNKAKGLKSLEEKLVKDGDFMEALLKGKDKMVDLFIPKFKIEKSSDLQPYLRAMGLGGIFSEYADFSRISTKTPLVVSKVTQEAVIKVDEKGTLAAAVTRIAGRHRGVPKERKLECVQFRCDRPFIYFITCHNSICLFGGRVVDPTCR